LFLRKVSAPWREREGRERGEREREREDKGFSCNNIEEHASWGKHIRNFRRKNPSSFYGRKEQYTEE
jgi:hypothetical protein